MLSDLEENYHETLLEGQARHDEYLAAAALAAARAASPTIYPIASSAIQTVTTTTAANTAAMSVIASTLASVTAIGLAAGIAAIIATYLRPTEDDIKSRQKVDDLVRRISREAPDLPHTQPVLTDHVVKTFTELAKSQPAPIYTPPVSFRDLTGSTRVIQTPNLTKWTIEVPKIEPNFDLWKKNLPHQEIILSPRLDPRTRIWEIPLWEPASPFLLPNGSPISPRYYPNEEKPDAIIPPITPEVVFETPLEVTPKNKPEGIPNIWIDPGPTHKDLEDAELEPLPDTIISIGPATDTEIDVQLRPNPRPETRPQRRRPGENTERKTKSGRAYVAMLRFINKTWGSATELMDFSNVLRKNIFLDPGPGGRIRIRAESIREPGTYYDVVISSRQSLYSLPVNAQAEALRAIADGRLSANHYDFNVESFVWDLAVQEMQDMQIAMGMRLERKIIQATGLDRGPYNPLQYGNLSTWKRRIEENFYFFD